VEQVEGRKELGGIGVEIKTDRPRKERNSPNSSQGPNPVREKVHIGVEVTEQWGSVVENVGLADDMIEALAQHHQNIFECFVEVGLDRLLLGPQFQALGLQHQNLVISPLQGLLQLGYLSHPFPFPLLHFDHPSHDDLSFSRLPDKLPLTR